ncbi:uncharacterized protein OCT59_021068 [Rhizophagus irregularis]|uniref:Uncharacterized protein n=2 Tax=Rhizophagus irregularis TaxID=588596 RepID=A0A015JHV5_RHIIW|nr:hypothetical protein GLOIN_2v1482886 [Rhizophagus irregularis DAOM 181602=DAOM 197198]EXX66675.1 hypothetical protein RirG_121510 [Rhizophagus irregularis DAOM 197198w]UZO02589.1 hypothetical protein OCT59_021068 [Rhizophagus irregularis]POG65722.1 hypothetical protein GLOIN_2v1482886 [Rhizophagus irregularis DAOM 181602=DAOM 197198]CAG8735633.1 5019_t:CDS:2 [Rhizophagus irregularis]GBC26987.1 hypothetical protein GLOIN_2v1482886 [Rhizophagus irregularis DAOM 181602=DAOM 197198]|eukprot:XP_025172588.1 hypothetical protein GLOIN_2v1482886 [Rhizophagus irregularis DAOM 181602=DAOM 197198]
MSESQFPRSLFPQFTEEDFKEASENFKSYVNWTEYDKWVEAGCPYEEHDEILMNLNLEHNGSSQTRSTGTRRHVNGKREYINEIRPNGNSRKTNHKVGKTSNATPSNEGTKIAVCKKSEHCNQGSGPNNVLNINRVHESNAPRSTKG